MVLSASGFISLFLCTLPPAPSTSAVLPLFSPVLFIPRIFCLFNFQVFYFSRFGLLMCSFWFLFSRSFFPTPCLHHSPLPPLFSGSSSFSLSLSFIPIRPISILVYPRLPSAGLFSVPFLYRICPLPRPWICFPGIPFSSILGDEYVALLDAEARTGRWGSANVAHFLHAY